MMDARKPGIACQTCATLLLALLIPAGFAAELYKWVDAEGVTHYSDRPQAAGAETVKITVDPGDPDPVMEESRRQHRRLLEIFSEDREDRREAREAERRERLRLGRRCVRARKQLQATLNASYLYEETGDPDNPRILSNRERRTETAKLQERVRLWCD